MTVESSPETLVNGCGHVEKIGRVVVVDIEGRVTTGKRGGLLAESEGRVVIAGMLHTIEDVFGKADDLERTYLTVGDTFIALDWDADPELMPRISVVETEGR
ncbi:hypothetical protein [Streptomyces sp. 5-10]|uniref:hypothetical protein n=1 Tax=Streptomyces sp. 5-10 TaxID=878925 RepID=UPI00168AEECB|nr:hypothetical protein [Streptomyces sp. 5-10]MBD3004585.1 hypothetical protein [Streptomyces sp. 5-10]